MNRVYIVGSAAAIVLAGLAFAELGAMVNYEDPSAASAAQQEKESAKLARLAAQPHTIYRLSVVPGGVHSRVGLIAAKMDPVVKAHYENAVATSDTYELPKPTLMYVSYRRGERVFWTNTRHIISGLVIDSTVGLIRARCGNRLSFSMPPGPFEVHPPAPIELNTPEVDTPVAGRVPELPPFLLYPEVPPYVFALPPAYTGSGFGLPPIGPVAAAGGAVGGFAGGGWFIQSGLPYAYVALPVAAAGAPEPGTLVLIGGTVLGFGLWKAKRAR